MTDFVKLKGGSARLRQLIREHGTAWEVVKGPCTIQCFIDSRVAILIRSEDGKHTRWVRPTDVAQPSRLP
jgi:hypothetical protein